MTATDKPVDNDELKRLSWAMKLATDMSKSVERLRKLGYSDRAIVVAFEKVRPRGNSLEGGALNNPPLLQRKPPNLRKVETGNQVELYTLEEFLSPQECERVIALIGHHLMPSTLSYVPDDKSFRTSTTAELCHLRSPQALKLDEKICRTLGIRTEYSEGIQAQRYDVGQQFKPHWDYYPPDSELFNRYAGVRGNRTWTFMVYLNEGMQGGGTRFTELGITFTPKLGQAVLWNNLKPDGTPNPATMHCGEPVISGYKVIITKWFRVFGHGPVFY
ncbi:MAG TPA: 2OG-Fe(II) oxygenase [Steroidobacteraceae bacterium]|jgi:prolyl 4-hydroxylase|nr:2OG-Fe(II) oxygenase [Steroidobacteraceae bacterium]